MKYFEPYDEGWTVPNEALYIESDGDLFLVTGIRTDGVGNYSVLAGSNDQCQVDLEGVDDLDAWWESLAVKSVRTLGW